MNFKFSCLLPMLLLAFNVMAVESAVVHKSLTDAIMCKAKPAEAVDELVQKGDNFQSGYAAYGFGEGTGYKAVVILHEPLSFYGSTTTAVISEAESSYFDFSAFTYGKFKGDYKQVVKALNLQAANPFTEQSLGKFVSQQPTQHHCPATIALTPVENGYFLLGCGWCNGG